jgi:hypothetical protein
VASSDRIEGGSGGVAKGVRNLARRALLGRCLSYPNWGSIIVDSVSRAWPLKAMEDPYKPLYTRRVKTPLFVLSKHDLCRRLNSTA